MLDCLELRTIGRDRPKGKVELGDFPPRPVHGGGRGRCSSQVVGGKTLGLEGSDEGVFHFF